MASRQVTVTGEDLQNIVTRINEFQLGTKGIAIPAQISYIIHRNEQSLLKPFYELRKEIEQIFNKHLDIDESGKYQQITKFDDDGKETGTEPIFKTSKEAFEVDYKSVISTKYDIKFYLPYKVEEKLDDFAAPNEVLQALFQLLDIFETWEPEYI